MVMKNETIHWALSAVLVAAGVSLGAGACDDSSSAVKEPTGHPSAPTNDSGTTSGGGPDGSAGDGGPKDCFDNPQTHFEIINACTNAVRIEKNPTLNKLLPDGGLPPLE
jgi:hypothetical protein